jgi:hypothetical protein
MSTEYTQPIVVRLIPTNVFIRGVCTICGGLTEKDSVLAKARTSEGDVRVCVRCLEQRDFAKKLEDRAAGFEEKARWLRTQPSRLDVMTLKEWKDAESEHARWLRMDIARLEAMTLREWQHAMEERERQEVMELEERARWFRSLPGRLQVPTLKEWEYAVEEHERRCEEESASAGSRRRDNM